MKLSPAATLLWVCLGASVAGHAAPQMRDAVTNDDLVAKYRKSVSENPLRTAVQKPLNGPDPTTVNQPESLLATSDFLSFGNLTTLIPKRALLNVPKNYQSRIQFVSGWKIVPWHEFFPLNRGWIKTVEVTRAQAEGNEPIDEKILEGIQKSTIVVVATFKGGPISVLPAKAPAETAEGEPKK